jgi:hypothetical protein
LAQPRSPRPPYCSPFSRNIHCRIGTVKPVFFRDKTELGSCTSGVDASARLPTYGEISPSAATSRHNVQSTRGTRTSTECVIEAQSVSLSSWLRKYHALSSTATFTGGEH